MAIKGQKYQFYPEIVRHEAVRLHLEEKWTYREITQHLSIHDADRVKRWMKKHRKEVERVFKDPAR